MTVHIRRLLCRVFGHPEKRMRQYATATILGQRSRMVRCDRCEAIVYGPMGASFESLRRL